jgi:hypothetical protein
MEADPCDEQSRPEGVEVPLRVEAGDKQDKTGQNRRAPA